jgi:hypothetical protein
VSATGLVALLRERVAKLVAKLPACSHVEYSYLGGVPCARLATRSFQGTPDTGGGPEPVEYWCDEHLCDPSADLPYAAELRAVLEVLS